jgi:site-specific DNA-methyltransferase (adenine-specific)
MQIAHVDSVSLQTRRFPLSELKPYPGNARRGDLAAIKQSLERLGLFRPVVVNGRTMQVLAGNHVVQAARELGWEAIDATIVEVDEDTARRIVLADNRTNDLAGYDSEALVELLMELDGGLEGTGFDEAELDALLEEVAPVIALDEDELPPAPADPITRPGELIKLGRHRLLCGDARDSNSYRRVLGESKADMLVTDPPYGVSYEGKTRARLRIANDQSAGLEALLEESFEQVDRVLAAGAPLYVFAPAGRLCAVFHEAFEQAGWSLRQALAWVKDTLVLGHADYHFRHEQILYGFKPGDGRLGRGGANWFGDHKQTSVFEFPRPRAAREHPTTKPPELLEAMLRNSSRRAAVVLDPFGGSGSTLVACERLGRTAVLIELDPRYADVIVERYERLTGERAERQAD